MAEHPIASVIVPCGGRPDHLRRLLVSLASNAFAFELLLVDVIGDLTGDAVGDDPTPPQLPTSWDPRNSVRVLDGSPPHGMDIGLASARNLGASAASSSTLIFFDVDCLVTDTTIAEYVNDCSRYPGAIVSGPVRYINQGWKPTGDGPFHLRELLDHSAEDPRPQRGVDVVARPEEYDLFWSLSFACTSELFDTIGGFDEQFRGYGAEDTDFTRRAREQSIAFVRTASPSVFHQWHEPTRFDPDQLVGLVRNARYFHDRWGQWPMTDWLDELAAEGRVIWDPTDDVLDVATGSTVTGNLAS